MTIFTFNNLVVYKATKEFELSVSKEEVVDHLRNADVPNVESMSNDELAKAYSFQILLSGGDLEEWEAEELYCNLEPQDQTPIKYRIEEGESE